MKSTVKTSRKSILPRSIRIFLLVFLCLTCISIVSTCILGSQIIQSKKASYEKELNNETNQTFLYFNQISKSNQSAGYHLFFLKWYRHYRNIANLYENEFDPIRRMEISQSINSMIVGLQFVSDILIITPSDDTVITKNSWYSLNDYQKYYKTVSITLSEQSDEAPEVKSVNDNICIITLDDPNLRKSKSVVCILINRGQVQKSFNELIPQYCVFAKIILEGQNMLEWGNAAECELLSRRSQNPHLEIQLGYKPFEQVYLPQLQWLIMLLLLLLLFISAGIALVVSRIITRPVEKIVLAVGGGKENLVNPFHFLSDYLNSLTDQQDRLSMENQNLLLSKARFLSAMTNEIYYGLLTNPQFHMDDEYAQSVIPELVSKSSCFLILLLPKYPFIETAEPVVPENMEQFAERIQYIYVNQEYYAFLWCAKESLSALINMAEQELSHYLLYYTAHVKVEEPSGFHSAYLKLRETISMAQNQQMEIPVSIANRIVNMLHSNHLEKCCELLDELRGQYPPDAFIALFSRIASELNFSLNIQLANYSHAVETLDDDQKWNVLKKCVTLLSPQSCKVHKKQTASPSAEKICEYIKENFNDPELCILQLSEQFDLHRTIISKLVKQETGITFSDWLQTLRIDAAMRLLRETDHLASEIAQEVGYANYTTFQRAFTRQCGCTPSEYVRKIEADQNSSVQHN